MTPERPGRHGHADPQPTATYRLQLRPGFGLDEAAALVPYLADLGISHMYLSPVFEAVPGSEHGYDVTDPTAIRAELGGRPALDRLRAALDEHGLGLLLDIVPNHQAAHWCNPTWWALLAEGPDGPAARVFDVDWSGGPDHPAGTMLLPVLGAPLDELVAGGDLALALGDRGPELRYGEHRFPLREGTAPEDLDPGGATLAGPALVAAVLERQHYRLAHWRGGADGLSYRRFFDVTALAGVRVEDPEVFERTHALVAELVRDGVVQGLRVDHVDGLADPDGYLERLAALTDGTWVVVEKILERGEWLPSTWSVDGTTGYEGGALLVGALTDARGPEGPLAVLADVAGEARSWPEVVDEAKAEVVDRLFGPEVQRLAAAFAAATGVSGPADLRAAVAALVASLDRYRLYPPPAGPLDEATAADLAEAVARAACGAPAQADLLRRLADVLVEGSGGEAGLEARRRLGQVTGAVAAKGVEDTALYRWVAFPASGDVGSAPWPPDRSADEVVEFAQRSTAWPQGLVAGSTHDAKRSEDVRARLALLPELGDEWAADVRRWDGRLRALDRTGEVDGLPRLVLVQTLVGAWPLEAERLRRHLEKALREAKRRTSWREPDDAYEGAVRGLVDAVFADAGLLDELARRAASLRLPGRVNALALLLGRVLLPGVPDVYQGNELWRLDLTDPDNRRPVDWDRRRRLLDRARTAGAEEVWPEPDDDEAAGLAKLWLLHRALAVRRAHADAFSGRAVGLRVHGPAARHVLGLCRGDEVVGVLPRFPLALAREGGWRDTAVELPPGEWEDALVAGRGWSGAAPVPVAELLARFPVALLTRRARPAGV